MRLDRVLRHVELPGELAAPETMGEQEEDGPLPVGELARSDRQRVDVAGDEPDGVLGHPNALLEAGVGQVVDERPGCSHRGSRPFPVAGVVVQHRLLEFDRGVVQGFGPVGRDPTCIGECDVGVGEPPEAAQRDRPSEMRQRRLVGRFHDRLQPRQHLIGMRERRLVVAGVSLGDREVLVAEGVLEEHRGAASANRGADVRAHRIEVAGPVRRRCRRRERGATTFVDELAPVAIRCALGDRRERLGGEPLHRADVAAVARPVELDRGPLDGEGDQLLRRRGVAVGDREPSIEIVFPAQVERHPGHRDRRLGAAFFTRAERVDPSDHRPEVTGVHVRQEVLEDEPLGVLHLARQGRVFDRAGVVALLLMPGRGAGVQQRDLLGVGFGERRLQVLAKERVEAEHRVGVVERGDEQIVRGEVAKGAQAPGRVGHRVAEVGIQHGQDARREREGAHVVGDVVHRLGGEIVVEVSAVAGEAGELVGEVGYVPQGEPREVEPDRPAFGSGVEGGELVLVEVGDAERSPQDRRALGGVEHQLVEPRLGDAALAAQAPDRQGKVAARRADDLEVRQRVSEPIAQRRLDGEVGDPVHVVEHEADRARVGLDARPEVERGAGDRVGVAGEDGVGLIGALDAGGAERGGHVRPEPHGIVVAVLERQPGESALVPRRQMPGELHRGCGLAVARRRDDGRERRARRREPLDEAGTFDRVVG